MKIALVTSNKHTSALLILSIVMLTDSICIYAMYEQYQSRPDFWQAYVILSYPLVFMSFLGIRELFYSPVKFLIDESGFELVQGSYRRRKLYFTHDQIKSVKRYKVFFLRIETNSESFHFFLSPPFCKLETDFTPSDEIKKMYTKTTVPTTANFIADAYVQLRKAIGIEL